MWAIIQVAAKQTVTQWNPLTLQGAGLYHVAMGAILGVAAWSRGQEKMAGMSMPVPTSTGMPMMNRSAPAPSYVAPIQPTQRWNPPPRPVVSAATVAANKVVAETDHEDADMLERHNYDPEARS
jgi:hypothetical protein